MEGASVVVGSSVEEATRAAAEVRQTAAVLDAIRARHAELEASVAEAEGRLAELRRQADELRDVSESLRVIEETHRQVDLTRRQAAEVHEEVAAARAAVEAVAADAARARAELDAAGTRWQAIRGEAGSLEAAVEHLRAAVEEARAAATVPAPAAAAPTPPEPEPEPATEPAAEPIPAVPSVSVTDVPEVEVVPVEELAADASKRLVRYLNDAAAVEREQSGLLQAIADATDEAELREEYESHRVAGEEHRTAVERRVLSLGGEPAAGRGLLGEVVARVWDVLHKPRGNPDPVEDLLKALSAAEFEAGMYLAVHALARAVGDAETADLAASHHRRERGFADRLRTRLPSIAIRTARARP